MSTQTSQRISRTAIRTWSVLLLAMTSTVAFAQWPAELPTSGGRPTLSPLLKQVTPAVVNVGVKGSTSRRNNPLYNDPFFRRFFNVPEQAPSRPRQSVGSGVIINADEGYVLTNHHVINNADEITVTLSDGREFTAELIGSDEGTDVALLQVDADNLNELKLGDSDSVEVGDFVVAIGNPFGLGQTVTSGIVSALGRSGLNIDYEDFIQTDASINPGNSGGALIDFDGNLIGINTAIIAPSGGNVGIGFAIPAKIAKGIVSQLVEFGGVKRGVLGVMITTVTPALAEALDLDVENGALINQVVEESAAEAAGLHAGDVVIAVDEKQVRAFSTRTAGELWHIDAAEPRTVYGIEDDAPGILDRAEQYHIHFREIVSRSLAGRVRKGKGTVDAGMVHSFRLCDCSRKANFDQNTDPIRLII